MTATPKESQTQNNELQPGVPEESPQRYANIRYEKPDPSGRYRKAFAWVGTLEQITDMVCPSPLPYQFELFGDGDFVTFSNGRLNVMPGDGYFEVFDIEKVTQAFPDAEVVYAIDAFDFSTEELNKIQENAYTQDDKHLWDAHEALENKQAGDLGVVALLRGPIPYREDLVRAFLEDKGLLGANSDQSVKYTLTRLEDNGRVFDPDLVADDAVCRVHDIDNKPLLPSEDYWVPAGEWRA